MHDHNFRVSKKQWPYIRAIINTYNVEECFLIIHSEEEVVIRLIDSISVSLMNELRHVMHAAAS